MKNSVGILMVSLLALLCFGCNLENKKIEGHYFGAGSGFNPFYNGKATVHSFIANDQTAPLVSSGTFVDFFRNGTYSMQFHHYEHGEYELEDSIITLHNHDGKTWQLTYKEDAKNDGKKNKMKFSIYQEDHPFSYFSLNRMENSTSDNYPFLPENNTWRINATEEQTTNQIIDRLQNHLQYLEHHIEWCNEEKIKINFKNVPSPIRVAGNGFQIKTLSNATSWCSIFSDEANCKQSLRLLGRYFNSGKFQWSSYKNPAKRLRHGLSQISKGLEEFREE